MASGFAYALAGGLKGFGEGLVAQAEAEREASRERVRQMFQREERIAGQEFTLQRDSEGREFTTAEREAQQAFQARENAASRGAAAGNAAAARSHAERMAYLQAEIQNQRDEAARAFQAGENDKARQHEAEVRRLTQEFSAAEAEKQRGFQAAEGDKTRELTRETGGSVMQGEDGGSYNVRGSTATPIKTPDGKPFKPLGTDATQKDRIAMFKDVMESFGDVPPDDAMETALRLSGLPYAMVEGRMLPRVNTVQEANKLPKGTQFVDPSGQLRFVP